MIDYTNTLIILDWDDTLFPTSWYGKNFLNNQNTFIFKSIDENIYNLLYNLLKSGTVLVVTNASKSWINNTIEFLPETKKIMKYVKVISARDLYSEKTNNINDWKLMAFKDIYNNNNHYTNIISIGDAYYEYNALINLNKIKKKNIILKNIKLMSNPDVDIILDQIQVINKVCDKVCKSRKHLDLKFKSY
jgi:hypothetical protein